MEPIYFAGIEELADGIRSKKLSPVEVVDAHLRRIEQLQRKLNAFVHTDAEGARARAKEAETAVSRGEPLGALHGVPVTVKSCIDVAGWKCPAGSRLRKDYVAAEDAALVKRLKAAGAILLGSTNTPEFLMAYETDNSLSGATSNPWNAAYSAGGSSGGEAAAIAAGCSMGGIGSDGGGSVRVPAHFCGISALKPTPGRVPGTGHFPRAAGAFAWLGVVGPMARTVADVRALFDAVKGPDAGDPCSAPIEEKYVSAPELAGLRVGILESAALGDVSAETAAAVRRAGRLLEAQHLAVEPMRIEGLAEAVELWWFFFGPMVAHLYQGMIKGREGELSPVFREYLEFAHGGGPVTLDRFLAAGVERDEVRAKILRQMEQVPILLSPVCAATAFRHGEGSWRGVSGYRETMRHSQWLNLVGFPGAVVPMGVSAEGLPIGVQIIGRANEDELVLVVAEMLEAARGPWLAPPLS